MEQKKYDVFISYSRKDYVQDNVEIPGNPISAIMECLDQNGVSYWVDNEGIYSGQEFIEVITEAINNSKMLLFVSSKHSNESKWTANEIFEAYDEAKLIIPFRIDESPYNKKFKLIVRPLDYVEYYANPISALDDLIRTVNKEKSRLAEDEQKLLEKQRIEKAKQELRAAIKEFQRLNGELDFLLRSIYAKSKDVVAKTKKCPVCGAETLLDATFCESCGWHFASLYGIYGVDGKSLHSEKQLRTARGLWKGQLEGKESKARLKEYVAIIEEERKQKEMYADQCDKLKGTAHPSGQEEQTKEKTFNVEGVSFKMIRVDGGSFMMGSTGSDFDAFGDEKPQHRVMLNGYYIGETQVTQALWQAVMGDNPSNWKGNNLPVESVSWDDCQEFIRQLNIKTGKIGRASCRERVSVGV